MNRCQMRTPKVKPGQDFPRTAPKQDALLQAFDGSIGSKQTIICSVSLPPLLNFPFSSDRVDEAENDIFSVNSRSPSPFSLVLFLSFPSTLFRLSIVHCVFSRRCNRMQTMFRIESVHAPVPLMYLTPRPIDKLEGDHQPFFFHFLVFRSASRYS